MTSKWARVAARNLHLSQRYLDVDDDNDDDVAHDGAHDEAHAYEPIWIHRMQIWRTSRPARV